MSELSGIGFNLEIAVDAVRSAEAADRQPPVGTPVHA
jgi:hypothetical protein